MSLLLGRLLGRLLGLLCLLILLGWLGLLWGLLRLLLGCRLGLVGWCDLRIRSWGGRCGLSCHCCIRLVNMLRCPHFGVTMGTMQGPFTEPVTVYFYQVFLTPRGPMDSAGPSKIRTRFIVLAVLVCLGVLSWLAAAWSSFGVTIPMPRVTRILASAMIASPWPIDHDIGWWWGWGSCCCVGRRRSWWWPWRGNLGLLVSCLGACYRCCY